MSVTFRDRYRMTVTSSPNLLGDFSLGTAIPSFQTFDVNDNGLLFDVIVNDGPTEWEIRKDCTYTHSTTTLSRGTFVDSSTGSPLELSINCVIAVTLLSQRALPVTITNPVLGDAVQYNGTDWVNAPITAIAPSYTEVVKHLIKNDQGIALTKGQPVYISGANGTNVLVKLAQANNDINSATTIGVLEQDLAVNGIGYVITEGKLTGAGGAYLNTSTATIGDPIWLSSSTAGGVLYGFANKPYAPAHLVYLGVVTRVSATVGEIFIKVQNGYELDELHNVLTPSASLANNDILTWETSTSLWKNKQLSSSQVTTALGYTPYDSTNPNGYTTNTGTVTNVTGTTPISVATGTTTPAISISQATTSTNGYLSSTDWNTFNNKGAPYTLPTASTTVLGGVKVDGSSITINGSGVISAVMSGGGTVTSVTGTAPISVATGTTTPAITISQATTSTNGYLSSTDWNTFNNKGAPYTLPTASAFVLGGIKIGSGLSIDGSGVVSNTYSYSLPTASASVLGGIKIGTGLSIDGSGILSATNSGTVTSVTGTSPIVSSGGATPAISISQATTSTNGYLSSTDWNTFNNKLSSYTLPTASASVLGGIKIGSGLNIDGSGVVSATGGSSTLTIANKTAAYTVVADDLGKIINCTSGTFTISLTAAATLGAGFSITIWNTSTTATDIITIDPNASETIDSVTTITLRRGEGLQIICDGTNWQTGSQKELRGYAENISPTASRPDAPANSSISIGEAASSSGQFSVSIGTSATSTNQSCVAIGRNTLSMSNYSTAIGLNSSEQGAKTQTGAGAMALGGSYASGIDSFAAAIANNTSTYGAQNQGSIAVGGNCLANAFHSLAIGYTCSATGAYSTAIGYQTTASGYGAFALGGSSFGVTASGQSAFALGDGSSAAKFGKYAYSSGLFAASGDAQYGNIVLRAATTTATATVLTSDAGAASTTNQVILPNNSAYTFSALVVARQQAAGGTQSASWKIEGLIRRESGVATTILVASNTQTISNVPGWTLAVSADTTNGGLAITATGAAATNIRWVATVQTSEVTYA